MYVAPVKSFQAPLYFFLSFIIDPFKAMVVVLFVLCVVLYLPAARLFPCFVLFIVLIWCVVCPFHPPNPVIHYWPFRGGTFIVHFC